MLQRQIWILVYHTNDIKLDFGATNSVPLVCCDALFDDFRGVSGVDVGKEMGRGNGLLDIREECSSRVTGLTLGLSSGTAILCLAGNRQSQREAV